MEFFIDWLLIGIIIGITAFRIAESGRFSIALFWLFCGGLGLVVLLFISPIALIALLILGWLIGRVRRDGFVWAVPGFFIELLMFLGALIDVLIELIREVLIPGLVGVKCPVCEERCGRRAKFCPICGMEVHEDGRARTQARREAGPRLLTDARHGDRSRLPAVHREDATEPRSTED